MPGLIRAKSGIIRYFSSHLERLAAHRHVFDAEGPQAGFQVAGKPCRPAEPDVHRAVGLGVLAPQGFGVQVLAGTGVVDMQGDPRQRGAQDVQALDEGVACGIPDAVVQVGARRPFRVVLQRFEPGQERRDFGAASVGGGRCDGNKTPGLGSGGASSGEGGGRPRGGSMRRGPNLASSKGPKPLQLIFWTTLITKRGAVTLAISILKRLRTSCASA